MSGDTAAFQDQVRAETITVNFFNSAAKVSDDAWQLFSNPSLEGRWWYDALEKSNLKDQFKFWYAVLKINDEPIVLAPLFIMNVPISVIMPDWLEKHVERVSKVLPGLATVKSLFVGSPCAEEGYLGIKDGVDFSSLIFHLNDAFFKFARVNRADMVIWKDFREHLTELKSLCETKGYFALTSFPGSCKKIDLKPGTANPDPLATYLATLDSARRKRIKKKLASSREQGELLEEVVQNPDDKLLSQLFLLFEQTYQKGKTKFEKLDLTFFKQISKTDPAWWVILRDPKTMNPVAFNLCFRLGSVVIQKFIGLNYRMGRDWFLYFRLWESAIRWSVGHGATEFQCGQTGYSAKLELGYKLFPLTNFGYHFNPLINKICRSVATGISWNTLDEDLAIYLKAHPELLEQAQA